MYCAVRGRPTSRMLASLPSMPGGGAPRAIPLAEDISLIVADVPSELYGAAAVEARLGDLDWVARAGAAHHAVSDRLARSQVVVPFRLFTLFSSEAKAVATLSKTRARIDDALDRLKGKAEWVVRIGPPDRSATTATETTSRGSAVPRAEDSPSGVPSGGGRSSGTDFLKARADAHRLRALRAVRIREEVSALYDMLAGVAEQSVAKPIEEGSTALLDASFLLPSRRTTAFRKTLTQAAKGLLREGCHVSLTGPWPPYSFVSLGGESPTAASPKSQGSSPKPASLQARKPASPPVRKPGHSS